MDIFQNCTLVITSEKMTGIGAYMNKNVIAFVTGSVAYNCFENDSENMP